MNIAKGLKKKNQLAGEVAKLQALIQGENVQVNQNKSRFSVPELYDQYKKTQDELVSLKAAVAVANKGVWEKVFRIVELKGRIAFLRQLRTQEGSFRERDYTQTVENIYTPQLNAKFVQDEVSALEAEIIKLQDEIDDYNHQTQLKA